MTAPTIEAIMALASSARLAEALDLLDRRLALHPADALAHRLRGHVCWQGGDRPGALAAIRRCIDLAPDQPDPRFDLGVMALESGETEAAIAAFRAALERRPDHGGALFNLAWALRRAGRPAEALAALEHVTALDPTAAAAWFNKGNVLLELGRDAEAAGAYGSAASCGAASAELLANWGHALARLGQTVEAERHLRRSLALAPGLAAGNTLGNLLADRGRLDEAEAVFRDVLAAHPDDPTTLCNAVAVLNRRNRAGQAAAAVERALQAHPGMAALWNACGLIRMAGDDLAGAEAALRRAVEVQADYHEALNNLGKLAVQRGDGPAAVDAFRRAHACAPDNAAIHSNYLFALLHLGSASEDEVFAEHRRFGDIQETLARPLPPLPPPGPADRDRPLRIGLVSPDFRWHAVALFLLPLVERRPAGLHLTAYYTGSVQDDMTRHLRRHVEEWREVAGRSPDALAEAIRADGIDILIDLAGHTANNALPAFARRPAPVQMTWLGYPATTGLRCMDYRLTNLVTDPPGSERHHTETLLYVGSGATMRPPACAPDVVPPPMLAGRPPTFGSLNKPMKITEDTLSAWCRILAAAPSSRLLMVAPGGESDTVAEHWRQRFAARGIAAGRIEVVGQRPLEGFLDLLAEIDVALDPFPYGGGTTTVLTLWMGVPLVAWRATTSASGTASCILDDIGLGQCAAADADAYVAAAVGLLDDADRLLEMRRSLRARMMLSAALDEKSFVHSLEQAIRSAWRRHVDNELKGAMP